MKLMALRLLATAFIVAISTIAFSQTTTNTEVLKKAAVQQAAKEKLMQEKLQTLARQKGWQTVIRGEKGQIAMLIGVDAMGYPEYVVTNNNIGAAATIGTNKLWPGGSTGLNLNGGSSNIRGKLGIWEVGGLPRGTHIELAGKINLKNTGGFTDHATHVAGTLIASGVNPLVKGMSFGQQELIAYDAANDDSEMMTEAPTMLVSNHSYGEVAGWYFNSGANPARWEFRGRFNENEDYKFGYYNTRAQLWDSIAYNAPHYLIVKSVGNNRNDNGPAVGAGYWRFDATGAMTSAGIRPADISNNDGYDIIPSYGVAKNILTVGAVNMISNGYTKPSDVVMSAFSSWGPTDDGRIKPDVSAAGVGLLSTSSSSDNAYASSSGTSMSAPNASGSLMLLQEYYSQLHSGNFMRAATLKGLVIHTADEAGINPGPDYQFGWGLINMQKAAAVITLNNTKHLIRENILNNGGTFSLPVVANGEGQLVATLSWTDPKGQIDPLATALNNPNKKLVHDVDIVIKKGAATYQPWVLSPSAPFAGATKGNNNIDNVERINIEDVIPGETYTIEVTHKGTLERGSQAYSLLVSGVGGSAYCASNPTNTAGARIDSVAIGVSTGSINKKNVAGCTGYSNFTNLIGSVQPGQTIPFFARLNSCDATNVDKIVKVFLDANNDGDFVDAGETLATSGVINGNGDFTGSITIPTSMAIGNTSILRVVMQETNSAVLVTPCGTYSKGETQDYRIVIITPSSDAGIAELISPSPADCKTTEQYATVRIRNYGSGNVSNIPLSLEVKQGTSIIATANATFTGTVPAGVDVEYTFQAPFTLSANTAYTFTVSATIANDQVSSNNQIVTTITTGANAPTPTGTANICGTTVQLSATSASSSIFNWYGTSSTTTALATGMSATTSSILSSYFLSTGEYGTKVGPANKMVFPDGGYNQFSPGIRFTASAATVLKTTRLYIGHTGKIVFHLRRLSGAFNESTGAYSYFPISSKTLDVTATAPTPPVLTQQNNNPADLGAIYYLGITVPEAGEYVLAIEYLDGSSIFRNNLITGSNYPYSVPGLITITGNTVVDVANPANTFYYYLYDLAVKPISGCPSARAQIIPTTSTVPVITNNANVLSSNFVDFNQWYLDGAPIPGATGQNHTATTSGTYKVIRTNAPGCSLSSNDIEILFTPVTNIGGSEIELNVAPNPARGSFNLQLETKTKADLFISLVNSVGQEVYNTTLPDFIGKLSKQINPGPISSGVYYLKIRHDKKAYSKKIIITQ